MCCHVGVDGPKPASATMLAGQPSLNPSFGDQVAALGPIELSEATRQLHLALFDQQGLRDHVLLGHVSFHVANLPVDAPLYVWLPLRRPVYRSRANGLY